MVSKSRTAALLLAMLLVVTAAAGEKLGRGLVAIRQSEGEVFVTWRAFSADGDCPFSLFRNGKLLTTQTETCYVDHYDATEGAVYTVRPAHGRNQGSYRLPDNAPIGYINIPLSHPAEGTTPAGDRYTYSPGDASVGDVDGDGNMEVILKWDPSNAHDNAHDGYTGNVLIDCYRLTGEHLWRIDLGQNIRAGAHYTQFMVYDLDGDGKAEVVMKTSDGTVDGKGNIIGDPTADYRERGDTTKIMGGDRRPPLDMPKGEASTSPSDDNRPPMRHRPLVPWKQGRILSGNEYLTVFNGETGAAMQTVDYIPQRGDVNDWGDDYANRSDRHLACVAYLDGKRPSVVMCRGYYTRAVLAAFDWDGRELTVRWVFDTNNPGCKDYEGQGNHNLRVGDVDGDGCDEIVYGQCAINNDGTGLYTTGMGHGDAMQMTQFAPNMKGMQVWGCHENRRDGSSFRDAATGEVIFQVPHNTDVGRCMAADIDPTNYGVEMWSLESGGIRNTKGDVLYETVEGLSYNMAVWWDGDLCRELLDKNVVSKFNPETKKCEPLVTFEGCTSINGTKATPAIEGDILGDWREEVLLPTTDGTALRLYVSTIPTEHRFPTFLEDRTYRMSLVYQNTCYNQPTQLGYYFGPDK